MVNLFYTHKQERESNIAMSTLITAQPGSLPGTPIDRLVIPEDRQALRDAVLKHHDSPSMQQCYIRIPNNKEKPIQVRCEIRRTLQEGRQIGLCYLTDYMMPIMDGIALTKAIRQHDGDIPVTLVTAFTEDDTLNEIRHPNTYIMSKPISYQLLSSHMLALQQSNPATTTATA